MTTKFGSRFASVWDRLVGQSGETVTMTRGGTSSSTTASIGDLQIVVEETEDGQTRHYRRTAKITKTTLVSAIGFTREVTLTRADSTVWIVAELEGESENVAYVMLEQARAARRDHANYVRRA